MTATVTNLADVRRRSPTAAILKSRGGSLIPGVAERGYHVEYRHGGVNYCPGCGRTHWHVGRVSAECAFCGTALPLPDAPNSGGGGSIWRRGKRG